MSDGPKIADGQDAGADLAAAFEALRPQLTRVAYGMLGSLAEAEDIVQEAWLRLGRTDREQIDDLRAWLTTVVGRLALDALGSARRRRESYVGEWLPEPLVEEYGESCGDDPTLDEAVSTALLVVLERLSPAERTAFLLHDVFDLPFDKVADVVGRSPAGRCSACSTPTRSCAPTAAARSPPRSASSPPAAAPTSRPASRASRPTRARRHGSSPPSRSPGRRATTRRCSACSTPTR